MRKLFHVLCCMICAAVVLTSCKKKEETQTALYNDTAITEFTLGGLTQYTPGTSNVVATLTGSNYKMVIDQVNSTIYNRDSLPIGTAVSSVVCTVKALNSGIILIKNINDDNFAPYDANTGIDFTQPRTFRVNSSDGSASRNYTVTLNVKKTANKAFAWQEKADVDMLKDNSRLRLVTLGLDLYTFGVKNGAVVFGKSTDQGATWKAITPDLPTPVAATVCENVVTQNGTMYLLNNGELFKSADGEHWQKIAMTGTPGLTQLFGAGTKELFALSNDGGIKASADDGANWTSEKIATNAALPTAGITCLCYPYQQLAHTDYMLMVGNDGKQSVVWRKISTYEGNNKGGQWVCLEYETTNKSRLPLLTQPSLVQYVGLMMAFGPGTEAYQSSDQGITWGANATYKLPANTYSVATDSSGRLWAIGTNGKVYLGSFV